MKPERYNSIMPRVAIENLKLIDFEELVCLIGKSLEEIFSFLATTPYGEEIANTCGERVEPALIEEALLKNYAKTFNILLKYSSKYTKNLFLAILHKFDALNLKTLFRMVQAEIDSEDVIDHIVPLGMYKKQKCEEILSKANTINEIIESISEHDFGSSLKDILNIQEIDDDLSRLNVALDKEAFTKILEEINNLKRRDKKIATNIVGIEIDALNVSTILKYKLLKKNYKNIEENFIPIAIIDKDTLVSAIKDTDIKSTFQRFLEALNNEHQVYIDTFTRLVDKSDSPISELNFILERAPLEMSYFELKKNSRYYNIGFMLSFLYLKWAEIKNLICIINAAARNVEGEYTHNLLILPEQ